MKRGPWVSDNIRGWHQKSLEPDDCISHRDFVVIDGIIANGNISWTGEEIRKWLADAGYLIVKVQKVD